MKKLEICNLKDFTMHVDKLAKNGGNLKAVIFSSIRFAGAWNFPRRVLPRNHCDNLFAAIWRGIRKGSGSLDLINSVVTLPRIISPSFRTCQPRNLDVAAGQEFAITILDRRRNMLAFGFAGSLIISFRGRWRNFDFIQTLVQNLRMCEFTRPISWYAPSTSNWE